jgi:hypothetical protein
MIKLTESPHSRMNIEALCASSRAIKASQSPFRTVSDEDRAELAALAAEVMARSPECGCLL